MTGVRLHGATGPNLAGAAALFRREIRRYLKEAPETVLAPAFSMLVYLAVFALALGPDRRSPEGAALLDFLIPGLVMFTVMFRAAETTGFSILFQKIERTWSDILGAPLSPGEITAAFALAGLVSGLATGAAVGAVLLALWTLAPAHPLAALSFAAGGALMMALFGMLVGLWAEKWDHFAAAYAFVLLPFGFLSGVFAPVDAMPGWAAAAMRANPVFYAIDGFRGGVTGAWTEPPWLAAAVVWGTAALLWVGVDRLVRTGWRLKQ